MRSLFLGGVGSEFSADGGGGACFGAVARQIEDGRGNGLCGVGVHDEILCFLVAGVDEPSGHSLLVLGVVVSEME